MLTLRKFCWISSRMNYLSATCFYTLLIFFTRASLTCFILVGLKLWTYLYNLNNIISARISFICNASICINSVSKTTRKRLVAVPINYTPWTLFILHININLCRFIYYSFSKLVKYIELYVIIISYYIKQTWAIPLVGPFFVCCLQM